MKKQKRLLNKKTSAIIKETKKSDRPEKEMFSFRLDPELVRKFKEKCINVEAKPAKILSKLMEEFLSV